MDTAHQHSITDIELDFLSYCWAADHDHLTNTVSVGFAGAQGKFILSSQLSTTTVKYDIHAVKYN